LARCVPEEDSRTSIRTRTTLYALEPAKNLCGAIGSVGFVVLVVVVPLVVVVDRLELEVMVPKSDRPWHSELSPQGAAPNRRSVHDVPLIS